MTNLEVKYIEFWKKHCKTGYCARKSEILNSVIYTFSTFQLMLDTTHI